MAVVLGAIIIRKCNINTIRSIFLWIRVRLVKSISKRINLKSLKKFLHRTILSGAAGLLEVYGEEDTDRRGRHGTTRLEEFLRPTVNCNTNKCNRSCGNE